MSMQSGLLWVGLWDFSLFSNMACKTVQGLLKSKINAYFNQLLFVQEKATKLYGFSSSSTEKSSGSNGSTEEPPDLSENLLQIKVYFDSLSLKTVQELEDYPLWVCVLNTRNFKSKLQHFLCSNPQWWVLSAVFSLSIWEFPSQHCLKLLRFSLTFSTIWSTLLVEDLLVENIMWCEHSQQ